MPNRHPWRALHSEHTELGQQAYLDLNSEGEGYPDDQQQFCLQRFVQEGMDGVMNVDDSGLSFPVMESVNLAGVR